MMQSLIHTLVQVNGSENNQKVFQCYEHLFSMFFQTHDYNQALVTQQKRISIFKELNGGNLEDQTLMTLLFELGFVHYQLRKYDDAI